MFDLQYDYGLAIILFGTLQLLHSGSHKCYNLFSDKKAIFMLNFRRYLYLSTIQIQMFKREPL